MEDALEYAISRSSTRKQKDSMGMAKGGVSMDNQMRMFENGGIADDGMNRDPVSGNNIPSGSLAKEVRDDIPAQLSEGEYVVPADVVRYFGVRVFEEMRTEAKMGLGRMEKDGRIGGEPVKNRASDSDSGVKIERNTTLPDELSDPGLSPEDLGNLEKMLSGQMDATGQSPMAKGGLLDKVEYLAKNDPLVNRLLNEGGAVVGFAGGGMTQSISSDPKEVDSIITKFMTMTKQNPSMMEELATRGIKVNRTEADQKPREMQQRNSPVQTTNPVTNTQTPPVTPQPIKAAGGTYIPNQAYATSKTYVPPVFGTLGGTQIFQGATKIPGAGIPGVTGPAPGAGAGGVPQCPPGQVFDSAKGMCVNIAPTPIAGGKDDDFKPPEPRDYTPYTDLYGEINWSDPDSFDKYLNAVGAPLTDAEKKGSGTGFGAIGLLLGSISPAMKEVDKLAQLKVARLIATAAGDDVALEKTNTKIKGFLKGSGKFVNSGFGNLLAGEYGFANALLGDKLKLAGLSLTNQSKWTDAERDKFRKDVLGYGEEKPVVKTTSKTTRKTPVKTQAIIDKSSRLSAQQSSQNEQRGQDKRDAKARAKSISDAAAKLRQGDDGMTRVQTVAKQKEKARAASDAGKAADAKKKKDDDAAKKSGATRGAGGEFGRNRGGLMKRNRIK
tara:strand:- start:34 stop:2028 length:1995 start_codon:yes stop_codon:yes gene_type:complete